ncbi:MAG: gephyrin-like molybdotransferase Glp [Gemmatimonadales bacterium]
MIPVGEASERILKSIHPLGAELADLVRANGRVLAATVSAATTSPPWDNSSMDGYAVRAADVAAGGVLRVVGAIAAGSFADHPLGAGEAMRIMTGAPLPYGADSIIRIEDTDEGSELVTIRDLRDARRNVRRLGEDFHEGDSLFETGTELRAAHLGVLASAGVRSVSVFRAPRVAIVSSGDELVELGDFDGSASSAAQSGRSRIVSSNAWTLGQLIRDAGGGPVDFGIARDTPQSLRAKLEEACDCDVLITTGGMSVGDHDYAREVFAELGGKLDFWKVSMRPGAPMAFGMLEETPWFGLSGNPVSAMITFEIFVRPALRRMVGHRKLHRELIQVRLAEPVETGAALTHFLRAIVTRENGEHVARLAGSQSSAVLTAMARANALLVVPADSRSNPVGATLSAIPIGDDLKMSDTLGIR